MSKTLLQTFGGVSEFLHTDLHDRPNVITTEFDPNIIRDEHKTLQQGLSEEHATEKDMYPVRVIPRHVMDRAFREGWFNDRDHWRRWANSEEGRAFGVERNGKVPTV